MACQVARALSHRHLQLLFGLGKPAGLQQRLAQERVDGGLKIEQAEGLSGGADGFRETAGLKVNRSQLGVNEGILRI